jgi:transcriptional regulator with XRE-family HTH domain
MAKSFGVRFGARLSARRRAKGISQAELAEIVDLSANYISLLERGQKLPTIDTLLRLAKAVDAIPGELLGDQSVQDEWLDELLAVGRTVPKSLRSVTLSILRAVARKDGS